MELRRCAVCGAHGAGGGEAVCGLGRRCIHACAAGDGGDGGDEAGVRCGEWMHVS